jgi:hypothetical protein
MAKGSLYLVAIAIDWATRALLAWQHLNTMDTAFWVAEARFGGGRAFHKFRSGRVIVPSSDDRSLKVSVETGLYETGNSPHAALDHQHDYRCGP